VDLTEKINKFIDSFGGDVATGIVGHNTPPPKGKVTPCSQCGAPFPKSLLKKGICARCEKENDLGPSKNRGYLVTKKG
jgi:hypothetical protein